MLALGTVLQGRYKVIRQLGQGGMGTVFEALDERLDTTVALKETFFSDERLSRQFEREARLLARLHHPALPRVSDHFSEGDGQFLVMQYIPGEDLAEMIAKRRGPFPVAQVLSWADQLLDALDYLHTQEPQIIHRDIKPQNLKQTARGQIILLDFGLAKGQTSEVSRVTTSASIFGYTPNYAPLEQVQGLGTDPRSDIYSLSATLYHLLTGIKPPDALTRAAAIVNGQPDPLLPANEIIEAINPATAAVLQRSMAQNRDQRFASADAMRRALHGTTEGDTAINRTEANTVLFPPTRPSAGPQTIANAKQSTIAAGTPGTVAPGETTVVRGAAVPHKSTSPRWVMTAGLIAALAVGGFGFYAYRRNSNTANSSSTSVSPSSPPAQANPGSSQMETNAPAGVVENQLESNANSATQAASSAPEEAAAKREKAAAARQRTAQAEAGRVPRNPRTDQSAGTEDVNVDPNMPNIEPPNVPNPRGAVIKREPGGVIVRTFQDGTQLITAPDGTRVLIRPNGERQVFRPGVRVNRRKVPRND